MDFFGHQAQARRRSGRLILLFASAVGLIVIAINAIVLVAVDLISQNMAPLPADGAIQGNIFSRHPVAASWTTAVVLAIIAVASLIKMIKLRSGGAAIARGLGGTLITADNGDFSKRRLYNVVEEMAIAAGIPMPELYVLEKEEGINAFAAGYSPGDAAITVTQGCLADLSRDELQGVIAHEFSHILNGDMRANIRLVCVLFGIMVIGTAARELLLRLGGGKDALPLYLAIGLIMAIGYIGLLFGYAIKAAVARQKEYLADAAAVQFTRQTDGLLGALKKIAASAQGTKLKSADAEEVSHMLFCEGVGHWAVFATHPPLADRIARLGGGAGHEQVPGSAPPPESFVLSPAQLTAQVGNPSVAHCSLAQTLNQSIPEELQRRAAQLERAPALVLALLLRQSGAASAALALIEQRLGNDMAQNVRETASHAGALHPLLVMPLLAKAFPALRRKSTDFQRQLITLIEELIRQDAKISLREYCFAGLIKHYLQGLLDPAKNAPMGNRKPHDCRAEISNLLATLATHTHADTQAAERAFHEGAAHVLPRTELRFAMPADWPAALDQAWPKLDRLAAEGKKSLIQGLLLCIRHDGQVHAIEAEFLRAICARLQCPLPPLIDFG